MPALTKLPGRSLRPWAYQSSDKSVHRHIIMTEAETVGEGGSPIQEWKESTPIHLAHVSVEVPIGRCHQRAGADCNHTAHALTWSSWRFFGATDPLVVW